MIGAFPEGRGWLHSLPGLIAECEARWAIEVGAPFDLSFNYVAPAVTANGHAVVLKLGVPNADLTREMQALREYSGVSAVRLIESDEDRGVMLLERIEPGHTLASTITSVDDDEAATRIIARVMRGLWRPLPQSPLATFSTVSDWAGGFTRLRKRFGGGTGPFPAKLVDQAESLFRELLSSAQPSVLLHGDLHHCNILAARRRPWLAIDPKGVSGEPAYEVGALLRNPNPRLCTDAKVQRRRVEVLHQELGFDIDRMLAWALAQAVLSAWWSFEDSGTQWHDPCACAVVLARLLAG